MQLEHYYRCSPFFTCYFFGIKYVGQTTGLKTIYTSFIGSNGTCSRVDLEAAVSHSINTPLLLKTEVNTWKSRDRRRRWRAHLEQVRVQHQPRDAHFGGFVHFGTYDSADDPLGMNRHMFGRHSGFIKLCKTNQDITVSRGLLSRPHTTFHNLIITACSRRFNSTGSGSV